MDMRDASYKLRGEQRLGKAREAIKEQASAIGSSFMSKDMAGVTKNLGEAFSKAGRKAFDVKNAKAGGADVGAMGSLLSKIGPVLMAIGALAAGLAAVVKLIIDSDAAMKELNRSLLEAGTSGGDLVGAFGDVELAMNRVRKSFIDGAWDFNRAWGTTAKDHLQIIGQYAEAGLSFQKIVRYSKDAAEQTDALRKATESALTYSKLLGVSTAEIAGMSQEYMDELGMSLQSVNERFSEIAMAARESNFSTKKFFGIVMQATAGMGQYNTRIEETVGLLTNLSKIVGKKAGTEMLQDLSKGFKDMSIRDKIKRGLMADPKGFAELIAKSASHNIDEMMRKVQGKPKETAKAFWDVLGTKAGVTEGMSAEDAVKKLGALNLQQQQDLLLAVRGVDEDLAKNLSESIEASRAKSVGGFAGMERAMQLFGPIETLLMDNIGFMKITGKQLANMEEVDEKTLAQMIGYQEQLGRSPEQVKFAKMVLGNTNATLRALKSVQGKSELERKQLAESLGIFVDEGGKWFSVVKDMYGEVDIEATKKGKEIGQNFIDLTYALSTAQKTDDKQMSEDLKVAHTIAQNTTEMTKILEQGIEKFMSGIYDAVTAIKKWLFGEDNKDAVKAQQETVQAITSIQEKLRASIGSKQTEINSLSAKGKKTPEDIALLKTLTAEQDKEKTKLKYLQAQKEAIQKIEAKEGMVGADFMKTSITGAEMKNLMSPEEYAAAQDKIKKAQAEAIAERSKQQRYVTVQKGGETVWEQKKLTPEEIADENAKVEQKFWDAYQENDDRFQKGLQLEQIKADKKNADAIIKALTDQDKVRQLEDIFKAAGIDAGKAGLYAQGAVAGQLTQEQIDIINSIKDRIKGSSAYFNQSLLGSGAGKIAVEDALITKSGRIIQFDPADNILAAKNLGGMGGGTVINHFYNPYDARKASRMQNIIEGNA
jgi:hypothetical protein